jgi:hypothetical protein
MSVRATLKLFILALIVFAVSFGVRRVFFWNVTPVSWDQDPQSLWALGRRFCCTRSRTLPQSSACWRSSSRWCLGGAAGA